mmetsp:Transcript_18490/g.40011  ORF Transcript_18490/g.40011 Transcript_18490/m.40011 type:complete len:101 (+) Transcript_18490:1322-1624(+)
MNVSSLARLCSRQTVLTSVATKVYDGASSTFVICRILSSSDRDSCDTPHPISSTCIIVFVRSSLLVASDDANDVDTSTNIVGGTGKVESKATPSAKRQRN